MDFFEILDFFTTLLFPLPSLQAVLHQRDIGVASSRRLLLLLL